MIVMLESNGTTHRTAASQSGSIHWIFVSRSVRFIGIIVLPATDQAAAPPHSLRTPEGSLREFQSLLNGVQDYPSLQERPHDRCRFLRP